MTPAGAAGAPPKVHRWGLFETSVELPHVRDPLRGNDLQARFTSPSGHERRAPTFWDGETTYTVRFAPDELGTWRFEVDARAGTFECVPYTGTNPLYRHGPPRIAADRSHLIHADGTPYFFLGDTVWNGPMREPKDENWQRYVETRERQGFSAAMFVTTCWKGLPDGGPHGPSHYGLPERVTGVNPTFYQHMDRRLGALIDAGLVPAPVLLWANGGPRDADGAANINPGAGLPEEDAIQLARYQVARWHAHPVVFILNGDGRYTGEHAARWHRIGRAVFEDNDDRLPVALHCSGIQWLGQDFKDEPWVDILGYQPGHRGTESAWKWHAGLKGPVDAAGRSTQGEDNSPARGWRAAPGKIAMNLEPCYEDHNLMDAARRAHAAGTPIETLRRSFQRFTDEDVRRAVYWSLLITPTAGVTYGGHGVWGWDPGGEPPIAHPLTGDTRPWAEALTLPGAEQLRYLRAAFESVEWWSLRPDQSLLRDQSEDVMRYAVAARNDEGTLAVAYFPSGSSARLDVTALRGPASERWVDPRTGNESATRPASGDALVILRPPRDVLAGRR